MEPRPVITVEPSRGLVPLRLRDFWEYRELLYFLTWRDIKIRYKQTLLGAAWAIIQPFFTMVVFSIFFGKLAGVPSDNLPYPLFSYAALVPWTFFAYSLNQSANSLVGNANLIQKVYFPRLVIPVGSVLSGAVDFFLAFAVLLGMMLYYGFWPGPKVIWLLPLLLLILVAALGPGLWLAALNVLYGLNPMAGVVEGFRWVLLDTPTAPGPMIVASAVVSLAVLAGGAVYFRRLEKTFADLI
jgi:lipopolysaccharide transport system permease protein